MANKKETTQPVETTEEKNEIKEHQYDTDANQLVTVKIPRTNKEEGDKVVWVNARRFLIKRGIPVQVPLCVYKVLEAEEQSLQYAYDFDTAVQKDN